MSEKNWNATAAYSMEEHKAQDIRELRRVISQIVSREFQNHEYLENGSYLDGIVQPKKIYNENTLEITRIRAELGDDASMLLIGKLYLETEPVEVRPSVDRAYYWLMKSAKCGNTDALKLLIAVFAGDVPGTPESCRDSDYAWDLLRMLSWIHLDGLLVIKDWYETGRFLKKPNLVQMLEVCKGLLIYRVVPKKYRRGWKDLYDREKEQAAEIRMQIYVDLICCALRLTDDSNKENYTKIIREYIDKAFNEEGDIFEDLAGTFIYMGRSDLLDYLASSSRHCAQTISRLYTGSTMVLKYRNMIVTSTVFDIESDFSAYLKYRYLYFAKSAKFKDLLGKMADMLTELYYSNTVESLQKIIKVMKTFNRILTENDIHGMDLEVQSLAILHTHDLSPYYWQEDLLHGFKLRALKGLMAGKNSAQILNKANQKFLIARLCFPKPGELFTALPMVSSREGHYTYYEELIHNNYDLSSIEFSAVNRLDICFDASLWKITRKSRSLAGQMMAEGKKDWELPRGLELELDRTVEEYLNRCGREIHGYWPSLLSIDTVHYSRMEDGQKKPKKCSINYMDSWDMPASNPMGDYIRALQENSPKSDLFIRNLKLLYRYYAFRILWYEAVIGANEQCPAEELERNLRFRMLYQKWKKQYLHFAEMIVQYVERQ